MEKRLTRIEKQFGIGEPERGQIAFVDLPSWPEAVCEAFLAAEAAGDTATVDDLVEAQTGIRPTSGSGAINMVITMPAGTVGADLAEVKPRYVRKDER